MSLREKMGDIEEKVVTEEEVETGEGDEDCVYEDCLNRDCDWLLLA